MLSSAVDSGRQKGVIPAYDSPFSLACDDRTKKASPIWPQSIDADSRDPANDTPFPPIWKEGNTGGAGISPSQWVDVLVSVISPSLDPLYLLIFLYRKACFIL